MNACGCQSAQAGASLAVPALAVRGVLSPMIAGPLASAPLNTSSQSAPYTPATPEGLVTAQAAHVQAPVKKTSAGTWVALATVAGGLLLFV